MPDVRLPNGTIVKNVPEGMTQAELKATLIKKGAATEEDFVVATPVRPEKPEVNTEAIENLEKQAEVDPMGAFNALASGINRGVFDMVDLPVSLANLAISGINSLSGQEIIPKATLPSVALDMATEYFTGVPIVTEGTKMQPDVDTGTERVLYKLGQYGAGGAVGGATLTPKLAQMGIAPSLRPFAQPQSTKVVAREGGVGTAAGGGAGIATEISPDSPVAELTGALIGSLAPSAIAQIGKTAVRQVRDVYEPFTQSGIERRIAEQVQEIATDPDLALNNLQRNLLILEDAGINPNTTTTAQLVDDPKLAAALVQLSKDFDVVNNTITRGRKENTEVIVGKLQKEISTNATPEDVVNTATKYINQERTVLEEKASVIKNQLAVLRGEGRDLTTDEESVKFVAAVEEAYNSAKNTEGSLWAAVTKNEPLNLDPLKKEIRTIQREANKSGFSSEDIPNEIYGTASKMGTKKTEAGKVVKLKNDFEFLSQYRSSVLTAMRNSLSGDKPNPNRYRLLSEIEQAVAKYIDEAGTSDVYRSAASYSRVLRENFTQGTVGKLLKVRGDQSDMVDPSAALSKFVVTGDVGAARGEDILSLAKGAEVSPGVQLPSAPAAAELTVAALEKKFLGAPPSFFKNYGSLLKKFPSAATNLRNLEDQINNTAAQLAQADGMVASMTGRNKVGLAVLLDSDPRDLYSTVSKLTPAELSQIKTIAAKDGVEGGLQATVLNHYLNTIRNRSSQDWAEGFKALDFLMDTDPKFKRLHDIVLTKDQKNALVKLDKAANIAFTDPTKGFVSKEAAQVSSSPVVQGLASMLALNIASKFTSGAGALALANRASAASRGVIEGITKNQSQALIQEALLNPKMLEKLLKMPVAKRSPEEAAALTRAYLVSAGIAVVDPLEPKIEDKKAVGM
jgi:hypothetical protein